MARNEAVEPRQEILALRAQVYDRFGSGDPPQGADPGGRLALAEARLLGASLLLEIEPQAFRDWLDHLVWHSDLSENSLNAARNEAGVPIPPLCALNSEMASSRCDVRRLTQ